MAHLPLAELPLTDAGQSGACVNRVTKTVERPAGKGSSDDIARVPTEAGHPAADGSTVQLRRKKAS